MGPILDRSRQDCATGSVGDFILEIADGLGTRLDGVVDFIDSLSTISEPLTEVSGE